MRKAIERKDGGFSILEVVIAAGILVIVALGVAQFQVLLSKRRVVHQRYTQALAFAEEKLEELRGQGYDNVVGSTEPYSPGIDGDTHFSRTVTVETVSASGDGDGGGDDDDDDTDAAVGSGYKKITVIVYWKDPGDQERSVTLQTIMTSGGLGSVSSSSGGDDDDDDDDDDES